jgi:DNA-binding transcriptional LysR family regulator
VAANSLAQGLLVALPLKLVHDTGNVGLVWREPTPGPALAAVLQAFVDASAIVAQPVIGLGGD